MNARELIASIALGAIIGPLLAAANVYAGLKGGFTSDGSIVAAVIAVALIGALKQVLPISFTARHTNVVQTAASAGAFCAVAGLTNAVPAMYLSGTRPSPWSLVPWVLFLGVLGVCISVPLRRRAIEVEKLPFPSGVVAAETIRALHSRAGRARRGALALAASFGISGAITWLRDIGVVGLGKLVPAKTMFPGALGAAPCARLTLGIAWQPMFLGIGAILGLRSSLSLALGASLAFGLAGPLLLSQEVIDTASFRTIRAWTLWPAIGMIVTGSLVAVLANAGAFRRAFKLVERTEDRESTSDHESATIRSHAVPRSWWLTGLLLATLGSAAAAKIAFDVPVWQSLVAVALALPIAAVSIRAVGETDISPSNNMAKVSQFIFAGLAPGSAGTNVAAAGVASGCAIEACEVMVDLKAGKMLGNRPRHQFIAQCVGVIASCGAAVGAYTLLVTNLTPGSEDLPAPTATAWHGLAQSLTGGLSDIPSSALTASYIAIAIGVVLGGARSIWKKAPLPSPVAIGMGAIFPAFIAFTILLGAILAALVSKLAPEWWKRYQHIVPAGLIVGDSLIGLLAAGLSIAGVIE